MERKQEADVKLGGSQHDDLDWTKNRRPVQLADFALPSVRGNEYQAMQRFTEAVAPLGLSSDRLQRLKIAVAEATMNAIEHGNRYQEDMPVHVRVETENGQLRVRITDYGGGAALPAAETPDIEQKLAGLQSPRGWGIFLIKRIVDEMTVTDNNGKRTVELIVKWE